MEKTIRFRTQYDADYKAEIFGTDPGDDISPVQQSMRDECDINVIMARYEAAGDYSALGPQAALYGDFGDVLDYKSGLDRINEANALFMELPAKIRDQFHNDPAKFVDYATDEKNLSSLREMGLAPPEPEPPKPSLVQVVEAPEAPKKPAPSGTS